MHLLRLTFHRGPHEIGGTCVEIASGTSSIVVDLGVLLVQPGGGEGNEFNFREHAHAPGQGWWPA